MTFLLSYSPITAEYQQATKKNASNANTVCPSNFFSFMCAHWHHINQIIMMMIVFADDAIILVDGTSQNFRGMEKNTVDIASDRLARIV